jgi:hypothetical protein
LTQARSAGCTLVEQGASGRGGSLQLAIREQFLAHGSNQDEFYSGLFTTNWGTAKALGGNIDLNAPLAHVELSEGATMQTGAIAGALGDIQIEARDLKLSTQASLDARTFGFGVGGKIRIQAAEDIEFSDATILAATLGAGQGGDVNIAATQIALKDSFISAETRGSGHAGHIDLRAPQAVALVRSQITSLAALDASDAGALNLEAEAGNIRIETGQFSMLDSFINTISGTQGTAGIIEVT